MSESITKEELLELGFEEKWNGSIYYIPPLEDARVYVEINFKYNHCQIVFCKNQDTMLSKNNVTKHNVLKLIEISKLIGELE